MEELLTSVLRKKSSPLDFDPESSLRNKGFVAGAGTNGERFLRTANRHYPEGMPGLHDSGEREAFAAASHGMGSSLQQGPTAMLAEQPR